MHESGVTALRRDSTFPSSRLSGVAFSEDGNLFQDLFLVFGLRLFPSLQRDSPLLTHVLNSSPMDFKITSEFTPKGDQPEAIRELTEGLVRGDKHQVLLGVTGSGKTFTIANVIANVNRPALIIAHNKTLAAQLYGELKDLFPDNSVKYFVSYYDYYQPRGLHPPRPTPTSKKDAQINEHIDRLRHASTTSLFERRDVVIVASVSCIYGIGPPSTTTVSS